MLPAFFGHNASDVWDGELCAILHNLSRGAASGALLVLADALGELSAIDKLSVNTVARMMRTPNVSLMLRIRRLLRDPEYHQQRHGPGWDAVFERWSTDHEKFFAITSTTSAGMPLGWIKSHQLDGVPGPAAPNNARPAALPVLANSEADKGAKHVPAQLSRDSVLHYPLGLMFACISIRGRALNSDLSTGLM